ncbi:MAG: HAD family hydrolase, partial [Candidatus Bathyarchaeia archaeon]
FWIKWNRRILEALEIHENTDLLARVLVDEWWDNAGLEPYDDAEEALLGLRGLGLKIGIVTNAFIKDIEEILARVSLPRVFDILVGIDSVGRAKPDPEVFRYAIKLLRIQPNEAVFIGDSLERDYFGALNAGLRAILIDRENSVRGDIVKISNLREIPKILDLQK